MSKPRLLDLYSGAGGAARGYQQAGFHVTGVDIKPQPRYAGDVFIQGDALDYLAEHGHEYDAIHASPPCQAFTSLKGMHNAGEHHDLLTPTRALLASLDAPWVIENVVGAPIQHGILLCGSMFGLGVDVERDWWQLRRHRLFESSVQMLTPSCQHSGATIGIYGDHARDRRRKPGVRDRGTDFLNADGLALGRAAMGIDWMTWKELSQSIPPAYCEYIGVRLMAALMQERAA
jgi:DNA (cytosine-5)-methyltransferase 1